MSEADDITRQAIQDFIQRGCTNDRAVSTRLWSWCLTSGLELAIGAGILMALSLVCR